MDKVLITAGWPPLAFQQILACLIPLQYACFPPTVPERERLLQRDPTSTAAYPVQKARQAEWTMKDFGYPQLYSVVLLSSIGVLVSTWRI